MDNVEKLEYLGRIFLQIFICVYEEVIRQFVKKNFNKMQKCIKILFDIYMKLNMFRATLSPSSGD